MTEGRSTIRAWFDTTGGKVTAANLAKRAGGNATWEAQFEMTEQDLKYIFDTAGIDVVFIVSKVRSEPVIRGRTTIGVRDFIGIQPVVVTKYKTGIVNIEGSEMLGKATAEIRRIVAAETDTGGTVMLSQIQSATEKAGSTVLFGDKVIIRYDSFS